ncbi:MAG: TIGR02300 family protein [Rickettsiales bacterium]|nr:TIGR02300 family protein [Rickettsiales bacterium]
MNQDLGSKRQCPECQAKFYDLNVADVSCPKCSFALPKAEVVAKKNSAAPKKAPVKAKVEYDDDEDMETLEGMGGVAELEELDDYEDDVEHLREVEDHQEDPDVDINSDDAEDGMFIDELSENGMHLVDDLEEDEEEFDDIEDMGSFDETGAQERDVI